MTVRIYLYADERFRPTRRWPGSPVYDLRAHIPEPRAIYPGQTRLIPVGFGLDFSNDWTGLITDQSDYATRSLMVVASSIDPMLFREIVVGLTNNLLTFPYVLSPGEVMAQLAIVKSFTEDFVQVDARGKAI